MSNIFKYKEYMTKIEYSVEDQVLFGKIEGIDDLVNFESKDPEKIEQEFHDAVDDYLAFCEEIGKEPNKAYKGTFNVRISPALHKKIAQIAFKNDEKLNSIVEKALKLYSENSGKTCSACQANFEKRISRDSVSLLWSGLQENFKSEYKYQIPCNYTS